MKHLCIFKPKNKSFLVLLKILYFVTSTWPFNDNRVWILIMKITCISVIASSHKYTHLTVISVNCTTSLHYKSIFHSWVCASAWTLRRNNVFLCCVIYYYVWYSVNRAQWMIITSTVKLRLLTGTCVCCNKDKTNSCSRTQFTGRAQGADWTVWSAPSHPRT